MFRLIVPEIVRTINIRAGNFDAKHGVLIGTALELAALSQGASHGLLPGGASNSHTVC